MSGVATLDIDTTDKRRRRVFLIENTNNQASMEVDIMLKNSEHINDSSGDIPTISTAVSMLIGGSMSITLSL